MVYCYGIRRMPGTRRARRRRHLCRVVLLVLPRADLGILRGGTDFPLAERSEVIHKDGGAQVAGVNEGLTQWRICRFGIAVRF